jgi:hypothetical protein
MGYRASTNYSIFGTLPWTPKELKENQRIVLREIYRHYGID